MNKEKKNLILLSFFISVLLLILKFSSYYLTKSNAILTDALESIVNVVASSFAFYSIYLSSRPKDENHPYGHGKIEFFSAGIEGVLIILAGFFIIYQSIYSLFFPEPLQSLPLGMALVGISCVVNGMFGYILQKKGGELNSLTLEADGKHLFTDAVSSFVLIVGVAIIYFTGFFFLDSVISLMFALYVIYNGYFLVRRSVGGLMDEANPESLALTVNSLNRNRKENWIDIHNMRVQQYGGDSHVDLHITLPYYYNLIEVHDEVHEVEEVLERDLPGYVEVFVHADPCLPDDCCHYCQIKDCAVRKHAIAQKIEWDAINMAKNQKHYHEINRKA